MECLAGIITGNYGSSIVVAWNVQAGDYQVQVIEVSVNGCEGDTIRKAIRVEGPEVDLGEDSYVCEGEVYQIDLTGEYATYLWGDGSTYPVYETDLEGWISLQVGDEFGCVDTDSIYLTVHALPEVNLGNDTSLVRGCGFGAQCRPRWDDLQLVNR